MRLASSFIGAVGTGKVEIRRCGKHGCSTVKRATVRYDEVAQAVNVRVKVPACSPGTTLSLRLTVFDASGKLKDRADAAPRRAAANHPLIPAPRGRTDERPFARVLLRGHAGHAHAAG